jgi:hypothetical protein
VTSSANSAKPAKRSILGGTNLNRVTAQKHKQERPFMAKFHALFEDNLILNILRLRAFDHEKRHFDIRIQLGNTSGHEPSKIV